MPQQVTVLVPATTANLGPGFDCLGMALDIWNRIEVSAGGTASVQVEGEGEGILSTGTGNLVYRAARRYFQERGTEMPSLSITCRNQIPLARGLGSSSAAIVGGLLAASAAAGSVAAGSAAAGRAVAAGHAQRHGRDDGFHGRPQLFFGNVG